jgi:hypothetical protein
LSTFAQFAIESPSLVIGNARDLFPEIFPQAQQVSTICLSRMNFHKQQATDRRWIEELLNDKTMNISLITGNNPH